jgi:hypothetical protein
MFQQMHFLYYNTNFSVNYEGRSESNLRLIKKNTPS